jgi:hypothetical protein
MKNRLSYANIVSTLALVLAVMATGGGVAYAHGMIGTSDIINGAVTTSKLAGGAVSTKKLKNGAVKRGKIADGAVNRPKIANGAVSKPKLAAGVRAQIDDATSPWDTIPSGRSVTGRYFDTKVVPSTGQLIENVNLPAAAPSALEHTDVIVTGSTGDATCTGSYSNPTAPAGKVCVYRAAGPTVADTTGWTFAESAHRTHVFYILFSGQAGGNTVTYWGSWAYTAP